MLLTYTVDCGYRIPSRYQNLLCDSGILVLHEYSAFGRGLCPDTEAAAAANPRVCWDDMGCIVISCGLDGLDTGSTD